METNQLLSLSTLQLRRAAEIKDQIDRLNDELGRVLNGGDGGSSVGRGGPRGGRRQMSAEGRRRIAEAARARWAKVRAGKGVSAKTTSRAAGATKGRRTMSAAARAKIAAAARARWAKVRAAKG